MRRHSHHEEDGMAERAAIVTGASSGIGLALAHMLGQEGHALTVASRRPEKLEPAAQELRDAGYEVEAVPANFGGAESEAEVQKVVAAHRERFGRLDVLCNNAGVGIGAAVGEIVTKRMDIQLNTNLRQIILFYRESLEMLKAAGAEHRNALVINTASISGKRAEAWLSIYSATKYAVVGFTEAMNKELNGDGIKSTALCPAFVDTPMTDFVKDQVPPEKMIQTSDIAEMARALLKLTAGCVVPEIVYDLPGSGLLGQA
jgi:NAD(P)-dependent dehydrogenase (short-subunit alcohol dehydrogenase family)